MKQSRVVIVGGGISGLTIAYRLLDAADVDVRLFEAEPRTGGTIETLRRDGYQIEAGPNGFLDSRREVVELVHELGLDDLLRPADPASHKRFSVRDGRLVELPAKPGAFLRSSVLSPKARLRVMVEGLIRKPPPSDDETVYDFARRRLGTEFAERLIDPMVAGVFAGDARLLSLKSSFPRMFELESEYGSLTRALVKLMRQRRREGQAGPNPGGFGGRLTTFQRGMQTLTDRLTEQLGPIVTTDRRLTGLERVHGTWILTFEDERGSANRVEADAAILALPAYVSAEVLEPLAPDLSSSLSRIPYAPIAVIALSFEREDVVHPLDGFGFVSPSIEKQPILGSVWTSSIFPQNRPGDRVLIRTMAGGSRDPEMLSLDDEALVEVACRELDRLIGLRGEPVLQEIVRWPRGIPQYYVGHARLLEAIGAQIGSQPGLFLAGNAYRGISVNDCVRESVPIARRALEYLHSPR